MSPQHVLPVKHALQGHLESTRLWSQHIHSIFIKEFGFSSCPHEPCLYTGNYKNNKILFLQQVDDFAISSKNTSTINNFLEELDKHLKSPLKRLDKLTNFNGIELDQTQNYIKVYCSRYMNKILEGHGWLHNSHSSTRTPMTSDPETIQQLAHSSGLIDVQKAASLQKEMGFKYCQCIGKLMFAVVTCRPDILFAVIYLSQYSCSPAKCHYSAVKRIYRYLRCTINDGIHFWRESPRYNLPLKPDPTILPNNHQVQLPEVSIKQPSTYADADWASNIKKRRSISGSAVFLSGGPVVYKCKFQHCVSLSSTESELYAASDTGKHICYI